MHKFLALALLFSTLMLSACNDDDNNNETATSDPPALEIAIREVNAGERIAFEDNRADFIALWTSQSNALDDREFRAFFNIPANDNDVFVGMTSWQSFDDFNNASAAVGNSAEAQAFFSTFDMQAFVVVEQTEGPTFDLANVALQQGQIIELAVRQVTPGTEDNFNNTRLPYIEALNAADGVIASYEFQVLGDNPDNLTVGMTLYNDFASFQGVQQGVNTTQVASDYFAAFTPVTIQYIRNYEQTEAALNDIQLTGQASPEDIAQYENYVYTSNFFDASIQRTDLNNPDISEIFVPAATDALTSGWGLRVDATRNWLLNLVNEPYDFNPANARTGQLRAYDLDSGDLVRTWTLPDLAVGNPVDIDSNGNYYIGDIGPNTRIIRINPENNEVSVWAQDDLWVQGGFGFGGMVYDGSTGLYGAHNGVLWYIPILADGSAGAAQAVSLANSNGVTADGMTWAGNNTLYYAQNDAFTPGSNGVVYRVTLDGTAATSGTEIRFQESLTDPSGVYFGSYQNIDYLFVNESQFGASLGVDGTDPNLPFRVLVFQQ